MKRTTFLFLIISLLSSCATKQLYSWDKYEQVNYNYIKNSNEKSIQQLIESYNKIIKKNEGAGKNPPPGLYANLGYVLVKSNKLEEGKIMFNKEISLYPESKILIDKTLKTIE